MLKAGRKSSLRSVECHFIVLEIHSYQRISWYGVPWVNCFFCWMSWYFFSTGHKLSFPGHFLNIKRKLYCLRHLLWRDRHCWRRPLSIPCHQDDGCRSFLLGKSPETQPVVVSSGRLIPLWQVNICHFVFWASPVVFNCLVWVWGFFLYEFGFRFYGVDFCSVIR